MTEMLSGPQQPAAHANRRRRGKIDDLLHRAARRVRRALVWNNIYRATSYLRSALWTIPLLAICSCSSLRRCLRVARRMARMAAVGTGRLRGAGALPDHDHADAVVRRVHVRLAARGDPGGRRPADAAHHRHDAAARQRRPLQRRAVRVHARVRRHGAQPSRQDGLRDRRRSSPRCSAIACMAMFLFLIDYAARLLRPVSILARVGDEGVEVIRAVYPEPASAAPRSRDAVRRAARAGGRAVPHAGASAIVLAVDLDTLVADARRAGGIIEFVPQVGDFVATDEPLFELYGGAVVDRQSPRCSRRSPRSRADAGAGSDVCVPHHGRHRAQGAVAGDQRSDNRPCSRSISCIACCASVGRRRAAQRDDRRRRGRAARDLPHAELGGLRQRLLHRDPRLRRRQRADRASHARDAREPDRHAARAPARRARRGTPPARPGDRIALSHHEDRELAGIPTARVLGGSSASRAPGRP